MNIKQHATLVFLLVVSLLISGCGAGQPFGPTLTPTSTTTPIPTPTLTFTPTPAPENLADAKDLHVWIEDYVHAYGGKVTVNGVERDANQLLGAVKVNPGGFIEKKTIKGRETLFFVVNGVPLAIQTDGAWRAILARDIAEAKNAQFAMPVLWYQIYDEQFVNVIKNANMLTITRDLNTEVVFKDWTTEDWKNILRDWQNIKAQLDSGKIPSGLTYNWKDADQIIQFARKNDMGVRGRSLVWNGDVPDSIYNGGFTKADLLKILEFTISVKLIKYRGVMYEWDAEDELVLSEGSSEKWGFWQRSVGLLDATRLSASLIRKLDPKAKITITDDHELEERFYDQQPRLGIRFMNFVKTLKQEGLIDLVDIENNLWIYDLPELEFMEKVLRQFQAEGLGLSAPEIMVFPSKEFPYWYGTRKEYAKVENPLEAQAEGYARVVQAYINVGAYDIGLGDVGDEYSTVTYLHPEIKTAPFDAQWKPRMGWYEILKVMYAGFFE